MCGGGGGGDGGGGEKGRREKREGAEKAEKEEAIEGGTGALLPCLRTSQAPCQGARATLAVCGTLQRVSAYRGMWLWVGCFAAGAERPGCAACPCRLHDGSGKQFSVEGDDAGVAGVE